MSEEEIPRRERRFHREEEEETFPKEEVAEKEQKRGGLFAKIVKEKEGEKIGEKKGKAGKKEEKEKKVEKKEEGKKGLSRREKAMFFAGKSGGVEAGKGESISESIFKQFRRGKKEGVDEQKEIELAKKELQKFRKQFKREPTEKEYDVIASNIYEQLKKEGESGEGKGRTGKSKEDGEEMPSWKRRKMEREGEKEGKKKGEKGGKKKGSIRRRGRGKKEEAGEEEMEGEVAEEKTLKVKELLGEDEGGDVAALGGEEDGLESIAGLDEGKKQPCPKCGKEVEKVIYCSKCGEAYCKNCNKKKEEVGGKIIYYCPECNTKSS